MSRLKVYVLSNDDLTSNIIFSSLSGNPSLDIKGVAFTSSPDLKNRGSNISGAIGLLRKISFRYWVYLVFTNGLFKLLESFSGFSACRSSIFLRRQFDVSKISRVIDFNSKDFINEVRSMDIDILVIRVNQILSEELLNVPTVGTICIHSSVLPSCGGIAAEFHSMRMKLGFVGTSIFKVTPELDEGDVLTQSALCASPQSSCFSNMLRNNLMASTLLSEYLTEVGENGSLVCRLRDFKVEKSYFSWPKTDDIKAFYKANNKLISLREILLYISCVIFGINLQKIEKISNFKESHSLKKIPEEV